MSSMCDVCGKDLNLLGEEGCPECGIEYDPLQPDFNQELDFEKDSSDRYAHDPDFFDEASVWED